VEALGDRLRRRLARRQAGLSEEVQAFLTNLRKEFAGRRNARKKQNRKNEINGMIVGARVILK